jgi:hypothetical protein
MIFSFPTNIAAVLRTNLMLALVVISVAIIVSPGCSGRKKAEQAAQEQRDKAVQDALKSLKALMTDNGMSLEQKRAEWNRIKNLNLNHPEVNELLEKVDAYLKLQEQRMAEDKAEAERRAAEKEKSKKAFQQVLTHFERIANAPSVDDANRHIQEALGLFTSAQVPVLIVISTAPNGSKDYDRPTTIRKYLDYIKDQRRYEKQADLLKLDEQGKIKELELIKQ